MPDLRRIKGFKDKVGDSAASVADSTQDKLQKTSEKVTGTASSVTGAVQDASQKAAVKTTDVAASALWSTQDALQEATEKVTDTVASVAGAVQDTSQKASVQATDAAASAVWSAQDAAHKAPVVAMAAVESVKSDPKAILEATASAANALLSTTQGLLASNLAGATNDLVQEMVKGVPTIYDKAMDAKFIETGIGGPDHRLFDGGHTIWGAFTAARGASPDDTIIQEAMGTVQGLLRDVSTPKGLPLVTWDKETFDQVVGALESDFHIPRTWFVDLATYDVADLLGSTVGAVALIFQWNTADTETFTRLVGSMGLSATVGANPLLLIVSVVALGRAFHKAHLTGEYAALTDGLFKGGLSSGAALAAVGLVGVAGGPAGVGLLASLVAGILTQKVSQNVSFVEVGQVVARQAVDAAGEASSLVAQQIPAIL